MVESGDLQFSRGIANGTVHVQIFNRLMNVLNRMNCTPEFIGRIAIRNWELQKMLETCMSLNDVSIQVRRWTVTRSYYSRH